jgi:hypothetical protein
VTSSEIQPLSASRQLRFHQLLVAARKTVLGDALSAALALIDQDILRTQLGNYVPKDVQKILAVARIRDEYVFPAPIVLQTKPTLLGYYPAAPRRAAKVLLRDRDRKGTIQTHGRAGNYRRQTKSSSASVMRGHGRSARRAGSADVAWY